MHSSRVVDIYTRHYEFPDPAALVSGSLWLVSYTSRSFVSWIRDLYAYLDWRQVLIAAMISVLLVGLLLTQVENVGEIAATVRRVRVSTLAFSFTLYLSLGLIRAWRFQVLLPGSGISFLAVWNVTCVHTLANFVMPARTGELTYVALLRARRVPVASGLASLGMARLLDLIALSALVLSTVVLTSGREMRVGQIQLFSLAFGGAMVATLLWADRLASTGLGLTVKAARRLQADRLSLVRKGLALAQRITETLRTLSRSRGLYWATLALSLLQWMCIFGMYYILLNGLGTAIDLGDAVVASAIASLIAVLPIQGLMGFGTYEAGWTVALLPLGFDRSTAVAAGFGVHVLILALSLALAGLSLVVTGVVRLVKKRWES
jgi:uncharacterized protein (TIRG00374 family)